MFVQSPEGTPTVPARDANPSVGLRHEPTLDGLRGLAVAAVVAFHLGRLQGGFLGVDLFFLLSGFLITSLLANEWRYRGTIDLTRFWVRRARRLLPALFVLIAGVSVLVAVLTPAGDRGPFRRDGIATLLYVTNWDRVASSTSYWDLFSQPSPLDHTWSLAVEEQFYVVWPLVFVAAIYLATRLFGPRWRVGLRALALATVVAAIASFALLSALYDVESTNRAYYGTDTRAGPILLGALLAMSRRLWGGRRGGAPGGWILDSAGLAALAFMVWSVARVTGVDPWYYRGGLLAFALAAVVVILVSVGVTEGLVARLLSLAPLQHLGRISYGVYLWHWPAIVYLTPDRTQVHGLTLDAMRLALTLVAAEASAALIERPIRAGALQGVPARVVTAVAVVVCALGVVGSTMPGPGTGTPAVTQLSAGMDPVVPITIASVPSGRPSDSLRVLVVGDSGPLFLEPALGPVAERQGAVVVTQGEAGCSVLVPEHLSRLGNGTTVRTPPGCRQRLDRWRTLVREFEPDVVLYYLAYAGGSGEARLDGDWVSDCDETFDRHVRRHLLDEIDLLSARGAAVAVATTPYTRTSSGEQEEGAARRVDCRNRVLRDVVARRPTSRIIGLNAFVAQLEDSDRTLRQDLVHFSPSGATLVSTWLFPQLEDLVREP